MTRNKQITIYRLLLLIISIILFQQANGSLRKDFIHYFDSFYFKDLFNDFENQISSSKCTISSGPNCFHLFDFNSLSIPLGEISNNSSIDSLSFKTMKKFFEEKTNRVYNRIKEDPNYTEPINISNKFQFTFLLTMESFNEITEIKDTYMPQEMVVPFDGVILILSFIGKIRLTNDHIVFASDETPSLTYGIIEETDVEIVFNKPMIMNHIFVRKHKEENSTDEGFFNMKGYNNNRVVYVKHEPIIVDAWKKVTFNEELVDSIHIEKGIEFDNMKIVYKSILDPRKEEMSDHSFIKQIKKMIHEKDDNKQQETNRSKD